MVRAMALKVGHSDVEGVPNNKVNREKMVQEAPTNSALRRKLGDITNLQNQRHLMNQGAKQQQKQALLLSSTEYAEKLLKENMRLKKIVTERNEIIERSGSELQKLRNNLKKVQEQNVQLAQGNTRIMAESNTLKDQLKALQHELGCKNGLLLARKLLLESENLPCTHRHVSEDKDHANVPDEACGVFHPNGMDHNTGKRKQLSTSGSSNVNSLQTNEEDYNKRRVSGRRNPTNYEVLDITSRQGESIERTNIKRVSLRRQSGRFNILELGVTENLNGIVHDDTEIAANAGCSPHDQSIGSKPEAVEPHNMEDITAKSRVTSRRQSTKQRAIKESTDPPLHDDIVEESSQISSSVPMDLKRESNDKTREEEAEETRNTSVGRPQRRAAVKIKSYKELSLKDKMRRNF